MTQIKKSDIKKVVSLLYPRKADQEPITKKAGCEFLGIPYNPGKLDQIIRDYQDELKRWQSEIEKPLEGEKLLFAIQSYIDGEALLTISKKLFKSQDQILTALKTHHVPIRTGEYNYHNPLPVPKICRKKVFEIGVKVFSNRYIDIAEVTAAISIDKGIYRIWLKDGQFFATQHAAHLSCLNHLINLGVKL